MNVYQVKIQHVDGRGPNDAVRIIHVLAGSIAAASDRATEWLREEHASCQEQIKNYSLVSVVKIVNIDWPVSQPR